MRHVGRKLSLRLGVRYPVDFQAVVSSNLELGMYGGVT